MPELRRRAPRHRPGGPLPPLPDETAPAGDSSELVDATAVATGHEEQPTAAESKAFLAGTALPVADDGRRDP